MSKSGRRNDVRIGADAMQRKNFPAELSHADCVLARNPAGGCPNTLKCRNAFGSPEHQSNAIFDLRAKLFQPGKTRSSLLKGELISMMHSGTCHFVMSGVLVCKSYYRLSTGFRRQLFDECINKILVPSSDELKSPASSASLTPFLTKKKKKPAAEDETLAALDLIFSDKTIKEDPTKNMTKVHVRTRWQTVYDTDYKRIVPRHKRVDYNKFVSIRKQHRPLYMKSPRMRKGGWDHMVCGECQRLEDEMYRVGPYHEMRPILEKELIDHDNLSTSLIQLSHRKVQKCTGKLFDRPDREVMDTVISTDAAGSSGFTRLPHKPFYSAEERPMREYLLRVHTVI